MIRLQSGDTLVLASHNKGKLAEFAALLDGTGVTLLSATACGLAEPEETETSFVGNARLKAHAAAKASGLPALADDSGFCVAALDGQPGIFSARWGGPDRDPMVAMQRVHDEAGAALEADPSAWFVAVLCLALPDGRDAVFEGRIDGTVVWPPRGSGGHGYDPMFVPNSDGRSFAEMLEAEKNAISHRARAFQAFREACLPTKA
ncbi:RdgB/HAM1 family non-canonical purine NTP pyrophosphatase [Acetobacteraceae bacterium KSS8]|uniref:dITP/XTP pyrophosphatase n=1 Tax=Endosaccharibacter trunci TaxID=2812733 RepID=A0ABT1W6V9_9PROT|nr:RdgB/HAM1 family non-canonical purine NTP pyrophosphatase [Acetobacteraceae bacterium KSS8]